MPNNVTQSRKVFTENRTELTFGDRLKAVRKARGLTQKQLAVKAGIGQCMVSFYERGENLPGIPALEWICKSLNVSASDLLGF